jgi:hypothetical protein
MLDPRIIKEALFPLKSHTQPKMGVPIIVPKGRRDTMNPLVSIDIPNLLTIRSGPYLTKGKTAE